MKTVSAPRIDWAAVGAALKPRAEQPVIAIDGERAERLLAERTRALARSTQGAPKAATRVLQLRVGAERYALPLSAAREVVELGRIAALPGVTGPILGMINWRGEFAAVVDLAVLIGAAGANGRPPRAIILAGTEPVTAIAVAAVEGIVALDLAALEPPARLLRHDAELFHGVTAAAVPVIDPAALVARLTRELQGTSSGAAQA